MGRKLLTLPARLESSRWTTKMPEAQILLSIITASLNSGLKLKETYASIASQQVKFEYIIMDGGSTDGSKEIGEALAADDPRVRFFSGPDRGVYDAMNKGVGKANGSYIYFIGAGDTLLPNSLREMLKYLPEELNSLVYGDCIMDGKRERGEMSKTGLAFLNICHQGIFYGREIFKICGVYSTRYRNLADWEFNMRCFGSRRVRVVYTPVVVANFEAGGISAGGVMGDDAFRADQPKLIRRHLGWYVFLYITVQPIYSGYRAKLRRLLGR
jgi:glycosyltransferase involved in cell wall biosynthesis